MTDLRIFKCLYCGKVIDLTGIAYKGYVPDRNKWSHYFTDEERSCTEK